MAALSAKMQKYTPQRRQIEKATKGITLNHCCQLLCSAQCTPEEPRVTTLRRVQRGPTNQAFGAAL
eukprot:1154607-Pelagomonas_calceolata.AAC.1